MRYLLTVNGEPQVYSEDYNLIRKLIKTASKYFDREYIKVTIELLNNAEL